MQRRQRERGSIEGDREKGDVLKETEGKKWEDGDREK